MDNQRETSTLQAEITRLRKRVAELEQTQPAPYAEALHGLVLSAGVGVAIANIDGDLVFANHGLANMLGYSIDDLLQMNIEDLTLQDDLEETVTFFERVLNGDLDQYRFEKRYVHKEGHSVETQVTLTRHIATDGSVFACNMIENVTELKKTREQLAQRQSLVELIIDNLPGLFYVVDLDGRLLRWNDNLEKITGYTFEETHLIPVDQFFPEKYQRKIRKGLKSLSEAKTGHLELELRLKNGEITPFLFSGSLVTLDGTECIIGTGINISDIKELEAALRRSEEISRRFEENLRALYTVSVELSRAHSLNELQRAIVEQAITTLGFDRFSLWMVDIDAKMAYGTYGTDENGELLDERQFDQILPNSIAQEELFTSAEGMIIRQDVRLTDAIGNDYGIGWNINAVVREEGRIQAFISCDNLINQQPLTDKKIELLRLYCVLLGPLLAGKSSQEALQRSEESWRTLVQNAPDIISMIGRDYRIKFHNQTPLVGTEDDPMGHSVLEFALPEYHETMTSTYEDAFEKRLTDVYEVQGLDDHGHPAWFSTRVSPVIVDDQVNSLILISRDITKMRFIDEQRVELQIEREKTRLLSNFISSASHEFRTPLSVINSSTYILQKVNDPKKKQLQLTKIEEQVNNITHLLNHLITMSRLDSGVDITFSELSVNDIATSLSHALSEQVREKNLIIELTLGEDLPMLFGATTELYQACLNVYENAITHSPKNGQIHIRTRSDGKYVTLEIQDQGPGIPKESLPRIFDRFYRADEARSTRGFGLGLPISKSIIDLHSGDIQVFSKDGEGTLFSILLPIDLTMLRSTASY